MSYRTSRRENNYRAYPASPEQPIATGAIAVLDEQGRAVPGATGTGLIAVGIVERSTPLSDDTVKVRRGCFLVNNSAGADELTHTHIGHRCYLVDDHTVAATDGADTRSPAGIVDGIDENGGVWVLIDPTSGVYATA
ncbi:hypothetical protein P8S55_08385 [Halomonas sp. M1]|uniref:hypothetical protein n=1 Tax=Halomonas sp. M1 TaxID=3035470 RepID=UPI0024867D29|nr:hypothetical protein [Halomonas sp. M1]WFE73102.1 hypothetical protein P8S55_08385 [Halomonas sp. M1]